MAPIKLVFGAAGIPHKNYEDPKYQTSALEALLKAGVTTLDTARLYTGSEEAIGNLPLRTSFTIDSKLEGGFKPGTSTRDQILANIDDSLKRLQIDQLDILYLHAPETATPFAEQLDAINQAYKKGSFRRFGLSNFTPAQVQEVYDIADKEGWVKPSVYQGNYSALARHLETILFPTLRKLGIAFYAYSPVAGGFLTKSVADLDARGTRWAEGSLYDKLYNKEGLRKSLTQWDEVAQKEGVSKAELAYRWVAYDSVLKPELGDAVIFGASRIEQIGETVEWLGKGGLSKEAKEGIDKFWEGVKEHAPVDNFGANKA